jgi:hypothetical protein
MATCHATMEEPSSVIAQQSTSLKEQAPPAQENLIAHMEVEGSGIGASSVIETKAEESKDEAAAIPQEEVTKEAATDMGEQVQSAGGLMIASEPVKTPPPSVDDLVVKPPMVQSDGATHEKKHAVIALEKHNKKLDEGKAQSNASTEDEAPSIKEALPAEENYHMEVEAQAEAPAEYDKNEEALCPKEAEEVRGETEGVPVAEQKVEEGKDADTMEQVKVKRKEETKSQEMSVCR